MITPFLQDILKNISSSNLPYNWNSFDFKNFSRNKTHWDFQQKAVENAFQPEADPPSEEKVLWKYYEDL